MFLKRTREGFCLGISTFKLWLINYYVTRKGTLLVRTRLITLLSRLLSSASARAVPIITNKLPIRT